MNKFATFLKSSLLDPFIRSFSRFTEAIIWSVILVIMTIIDNEITTTFPLVQLVSVMWLILPFLVFKTLLLERVKLPKYWQYVLTGSILLLGVAYFFLRLMTTDVPIWEIRHFSLWAIVLLSGLTIAYFPKRENFPTYLIFLASKFFVTVFYSAVLWGGLSMVFGSIESLFNVDLGNYFFIDLFIAVIGLVSVPVFLGFAPKMETEMGIDQYSKIWKTVFSFIILPIVAVFSFILLLYVVTSTINSNYYPDVYLISSLAVGLVGLVTLLVLEPFEKETPHIHFFSQWWPVVLFAVFAGFYFELIRSLIADGFTLTSSAYLYFSLWVVACAILHFIRKYPFKMKFGQTLSSAMVCTILLVSFVPYVNILSLTTYSMNARFEKVLTDYGMLENGEIVHPDTPLTAEQMNTIYAMVASFSSVGYERINLLPEGYVLTDFQTVFGFADQYHYVDDDIISVSFGTYTTLEDLSPLLDHDRLLVLNVNGNRLDNTADYTFTKADDGPIWTLTIQTPLTVIDLAMDDIALAVYHDVTAAEGESWGSIYDFTYSGATAEATYDIYFQSLAGDYNATTDKMDVRYFSFYIGISFI
ncbi:MAG: DUF4153 domain-containing protein [Firmicutes bacterium]|nr:DUF4153 domain-containing protein [Bacillota bacterium]